MKAFEAINPEGVFLYAGQNFSDASRLLIDHHLIAAPVLNHNKKCLGIVSTDLLLDALLKSTSADQDIQQIVQDDYGILDVHDEIIFDPNNTPAVTIVCKDGIPIGMIDYSYLLELYSRRDTETRMELKATVDAVDTHIMSIDNEGRIRIINKWMAKVLDLNIEFALNTFAAEVIDNPEIIALLQKQIIIHDQKMNLKGHNYIPFAKNIITEGECIGRVLLLRDVSEVEVLVRESVYTKRLNRELEAIIESMFDGLYVTDGQANTLRINKGFERVMGITA
ncbi:MAG: hypothetical protein GX808_00250, partial [Syntrophomonadaceae bacterium]|nr:hypothetical protein [Syntrophomonadaceae bacterium]